MGEGNVDTKIHVTQGMPWIEAVITLLQPDSPYRPWRVPGDVQPGDSVIAFLDTDPISVIGAVGVVGADGDAARALTELPSSALLDLGTLSSLMHVSIQNDGVNVTLGNAARLAEVLGDGTSVAGGLSYRHGHTTLAAARILLNSGGHCTGCARRLDLTRADARYHLHIHTVDFDPVAPRMPVAYVPPRPEGFYGADSIMTLMDRWQPVSLPPDWPAVLCDHCHDRMRLGGFTSFLDYRFSRHPHCPSCSARWSLRTTAGFVAVLPDAPWTRHTGCCPDQKWLCGACGHRWGGSNSSFDSPSLE